MKFIVALAQIDATLANLPKNVSKHIDFIRRAREGGADLVVFPELSLTGYSIKDSTWDVALRQNDVRLRTLIEASRDISILAGGIEQSLEYGLFNAAYCFEQEKCSVVHRKIYPPTYGMFEELRYFSAGKRVQAFDSILGRMGVLICEDLWHLPLPYVLAKDGAHVIIGMAASPTRLGGTEEPLLNARINLEQHASYARLLSSYLIFCNRVGFEDGVNFWGGSEIIDPSGNVVAQAKYFDEDLVFAEIDENAVRRARQLSRHFLDDDVRLIGTELNRVIRERSE
jgi:predicted amidohydrolase